MTKKEQAELNVEALEGIIREALKEEDYFAKVMVELREFAEAYFLSNPEAEHQQVLEAWRQQSERKRYQHSLVTPDYTGKPFALWHGEDPKAISDSPLLKVVDTMGNPSSLYERERLVDASQAREEVREAVPESTRRAYSGDIRYWGAWCSAMGIGGDVPLSSEAVLVFVVDHLNGFLNEKGQEVDSQLVDQRFKKTHGPHSWATVERRLASLSVFWEGKRWPNNPVKDQEVKSALRQLKKKYASSNQSRAITRSILLDLIEQTKKSHNPAKGLRDRALLAFAFATGGRRRSEIEQARIEDLEEVDGGFLFLQRKSKTNKSGDSEARPVKQMAAVLLEEWLGVLGRDRGPLFPTITKGGEITDRPLKGAFINRLVKELAEKAGYDPSMFSSHGLRSGFVTQGSMDQVPLTDLSSLTGHKHLQSLMGYFRMGDVMRSKAGSLL